ncbi:type II toxin-antitoxin system RelE/ParE family toxin [Allocoleopsis franciscana]|uniref:Plasmid stabilization system protein n=1 Tax=Allocoleopsis franciscana PCC 7113 TaxID=1173027 RepID=K9WPI2_9CYAN|nr:type II toxin-antitoxin system RelE/ParE family toxin [Allocoleopsis franciscana]AFZ22305.1 plasmid stabilization system protein [Allocoleopsis franciscana PCC 7113]
MSRYLISPSASRDLNAIADYFLTRNVDAGERLFHEFTKKCQYIAQFPNLGKSYSYLRPSLRGLPLDGYIIFYRVVEDGVEIVRVVSGRQDLESLFSESDDG